MRPVLLFAVLVVAGCNWIHREKQPGNDLNHDDEKAPRVEVFDTSDQVQALLRDRVRKKFGTSDDFQVLVTDVGYPIGTLMREGRTVGLNRTACAPAADVQALPLPNMFSEILMKGKAAFDLGLDSAALANLSKFGVGAGQEDTFSLSVHGADGRFLLDDELQDLLKQPSCSAYLAGKTLLLVRGYVEGVRSYLLQRTSNATGEIGLTSVGGLKVEGSGANGVSLSDVAPTEFLQIVSKVTVPAPGTTVAYRLERPVATSGIGPVYLQRDTNDSSDNSTKLKDLLSAQSFAVVPEVEAIDSDKMPGIAQVRYFNKGDEGAADKALAILRGVFPSAAKLFIGLSAPRGQLEIWLPKASDSVSAEDRMAALRATRVTIPEDRLAAARATRVATPEDRLAAARATRH